VPGNEVAGGLEGATVAAPEAMALGVDIGPESDRAATTGEDLGVCALGREPQAPVQGEGQDESAVGGEW
jgi:hypothetical protein